MISHVTISMTDIPLQIEAYPTFQELVEQVVHNLDGAYALVFKSSLFPGEVVAARYICICTYIHTRVDILVLRKNILY